GWLCSQGDEIPRIVALARSCTRAEYEREGFDLFRVELDVHRRDVLLEPLLLLRARDREDVPAAREQPREGHLRRRRAALRRDRFERLDELQVLLEIAGPEARLLAPDVVRRDVLDSPDVAGQQSPAERRIGDEADS